MLASPPRPCHAERVRRAGEPRHPYSNRAFGGNRDASTPLAGAALRQASLSMTGLGCYLGWWAHTTVVAGVVPGMIHTDFDAEQCELLHSSQSGTRVGRSCRPSGTRAGFRPVFPGLCPGLFSCIPFGDVWHTNSQIEIHDSLVSRSSPISARPVSTDRGHS